MTGHLALVTDFDGTISADDFFTLAADRYFNEEMLAPWREYLTGNKKHFDALNEMFQKLRNLPELEDFVKSIPLDPCFPEVVKLCCQKHIPVYICSAGCNWYINLLIGKLIHRYDICLVTNPCDYSPQTGLVMHRLPETHPCYDDKIGISKAAVVKNLQSEGYQVVFAGDGPPDIEPARLADVVFAKKRLLDMCREENIVTKPFTDFNDVCTFLKEN